MDIRIEPHTIAKAEERGTNENEIIDVINSGSDVKAKYNKFGKTKIFEFKQLRNGKFYEQKKVEVYYTIENNEIITITVYVFYGKWENIK